MFYLIWIVLFVYFRVSFLFLILFIYIKFILNGLSLNSVFMKLQKNEQGRISQGIKTSLKSYLS